MAFQIATDEKNIEQIKLFNYSIIGICLVIFLVFNLYYPIYLGDVDRSMLLKFSGSTDNFFYIYPLITANFLHGGLIHIFLNLFFFKQFEKTFSAIMEFKTYFNLFFISMIGSSIGVVAQILIADYHVNVLGLSGVIFGLFGFLFNLISLKGKIINFVLIFGYHALFIFYLDTVKIAWAVHLGGFVTGYFYYVYLDKIKK